jgi:hypothetical protein
MGVSLRAGLSEKRLPGFIDYFGLLPTIMKVFEKYPLIGIDSLVYKSEVWKIF